MRYCLAALLLFAALPVMNVVAAPVPDPSAILDIGPPPKGWSMEKHLKSEIDDHLTSPYGRLFAVWLDPEIRRLPSVAASKDARSWLTSNLRVTKEDGGSRLRLTFRSGKRAEQVAILNALLRAYIQAAKEKQRFHEECLRGEEEGIPELERRIASGQHRESIDRYRKAIEDGRSIHIPARRAEIARWKQIAVIRWAK
jgi:hypothetical protein